MRFAHALLKLLDAVAYNKDEDTQTVDWIDGLNILFTWFFFVFMSYTFCVIFI